MKKFWFAFLLLVLFLGREVFSADKNYLNLYYPVNNSNICATSTFFVGQTNPKAVLTINGKPVKVYSNGSFVRVFDLNKGNNTIVLKSICNGEVMTKSIFLGSMKNSASTKASSAVFFPKEAVIQVVKDETALRTSPYGNRLTPAKKGVVFEATGIINNHYKVRNGNEFAYVIKNDVTEVDCLKAQVQIIKSITVTEDNKDIVAKIPTEQPFAVQLKTDNNKLIVSSDDVKFNFRKKNIYSPFINKFEFSDNEFSLTLSKDEFNGYDYQYNGNELQIRIRKPFSTGLRRKIIVIDPGHGGKECGSIGPTGVPEKDINLKIASYLKTLLEEKGAIVFMTRQEDNFVGLYERVDFAREKKADILLSIHNNALPDGQNPYITHGTTTYYYQPQAKKFADIMQNALLKRTGFNNLGIKTGSFVLTRPSMPLSLLVEVGFMINPFEYEKLTDENFQKQCALGLKEGLENYFK